MSDLYLDLAQTGTGHAGTIIDAFSWDDFNGKSDWAVGTILYVKGTKIFTSFTAPSVSSRQNVTITKWGDTPWYIENDNDDPFRNVGLITNGVYNKIRRIWDALSNLIVYGSEIANLEFKNYQGSTTIKGCIFKGTFPLVVSGAVAYTFYDCMFNVPSVSGDGCGATPTFNKCVFTCASGNIFGTKNNCQFSWTPPTWPAWNASKENWNYSVLSAGINTPPQPGTTPYTGYEDFIFGAARTGIGNGYTSLPTCWKFIAKYFNSNKFFELTGPDNAPNSFTIPKNVDPNSAVLIEHGKRKIGFIIS